MKTSSKFAFALTGLAVLCVCAAMAAPMGAGVGADRDGMQHNGERMQQMIETMQANGVDTAALETALEDGDREAVHTFLQENRPADAPEQNGEENSEGQMHAMNEERMQEMIAKMQANGVDTTALETALEDGDRETVHTFMEANRPSDAPEQNGEENGEGQMHAMNEERMQEMITKMQANGVDTTALETALEDGDREAVHTFLQENRPADAGTGNHHGGPTTE